MWSWVYWIKHFIHPWIDFFQSGFEVYSIELHKILYGGSFLDSDDESRDDEYSDFDRKIYQKISHSFVSNVFVEAFSTITEKFTNEKEKEKEKENDLVDNDWVLIKKKL